ncbi:signal peptidase II, partial [Colwellia sp. BRX8-8]|nr:signal peptidase II [Colwellia sp. BRX8-8]
LIDRALFGYVIDFLDFYIADNHWPAFNVADSAIFIGAALMIFDSFKNGDSAKKTEITKTKVDEK